MPYSRTYSSLLPALSRDGRGEWGERFHVAFKLGPYQIGHAAIDVTMVDLGESAILGDDPDLASYHGRQLLLSSVPDSLPLASLCCDDAFLAYPFYGYDRCWVTTEGGFDAYLATFSKTSRKGLRRRVKQLTSESGGALDIRRYAASDVMTVFHDDARDVSTKTFQEKLMNDGLPSGDDFRQDMKRKADRNMCYGSILYLHDQPISYLYCERQGPGWLATYGGFDPAFARFSPGTVHLLSVLEDAFGDRDSKLFDFGPGRSDYKQVFATDAVPSSDVLILRKTFRNRLITNTHYALGCVSHWAVNLAEGLKLKTVIRQKIRGR